MARLGTLKLEGMSGTIYRFHIYPWATTFKALGGVYFVTHRFAKPNGKFQHERLYLGQTPDLSRVFAKPHRQKFFQAQFANCVCVHRENDQVRRLQIEQDLFPKHKTRLNARSSWKFLHGGS